MSRRLRRRAATCFAGALIGLVAGALGGALVASAQPLPQSRVLAIPPADHYPETDIASVYAEGARSESSVTFVVQLRDGVPDYEAGYRLSVVVGNPSDQRVRASMVLVDGQPTGELEATDGSGWTPIGPTVATFDSSAGRASVVMPVDVIAEDAAIRGEAAFDSGFGVLESFTTWFSASALLSEPEQPLLPGNYWGTPVASDGVAADEAVRLDTPGPWSSVVNRALIIGTSGSPPEELLGSTVVGAVVFVRIADGYDEATGSADFIMMDRTTGEVRLMKGGPDGPQDVSGDRRWLGFGLPPEDPGAPTSSSFDLEQLGLALGEPLDPSTTSIAIDETFLLADGRQVTAAGVAATLGWYSGVEQASVEPAEPDVATGVTEVGSADERDVMVPALVGGAIAVVLVVVVVVATVRRRGATPSPVLASAVDEPPVPAERPVVAESPPASPVEASASPPPAAADAKPSPVPSPNDALAALDAEFAELQQRMARNDDH